MRKFILFGFLSACASEKNEEQTTNSEPSTEPSTEEIPSSFEVTGTVIDSEGAPVSEAMVLVGGQKDTLVYTDTQGNFSLWYTNLGVGVPAIVASKHGFRTQGYEFFKPDTPITLEIREVKEPDNIEYEFQNPGTGFDEMEENCSHCHTSFVRDFVSSKHSEATSNPLLQDLYAGITRLYATEEACVEVGGTWAQGLEPGTTDTPVDKCYLGGGVLSELNSSCGGEGQLACDDPDLEEESKPTSFGACADCHASGIDGELGDRNLHDAVGLAYDLGVHCDTCHKVRDVDMSKPAGYGKRLIVHRPGEEGRNTFLWDPVYYGPLIDVPNVAMAASPQLKFNESVFCAGCHEQNQEALLPEQSLDESIWPAGLPIHSTYTEWEEGPYNREETQCQWCHMPADTEKNNAVDISTTDNQSITFGFPREPEDIRRHIFRSPLDGEPRLIDTALHLSLGVEKQGETLSVTASIANIGCGHAIPTGEPMRSLILLVEAEGTCGELEASGGMTINDIGGSVLQGIVGDELIVDGTELTWATGASRAEIGQRIRVVRASGIYDDYIGIGRFADSGLSAEEKGLEIFEPVAEREIVSIDQNASKIHIDEGIDLQIGDIIYLGDELSEEDLDGQDATYLAGHSGYSFAKVLVDAEGNRHVPHYRAVDIASDNRIAPGKNMLTTHEFFLPAGCISGSVHAQVLYRPVPLNLAGQRGWETKDYVIGQASQDW